MAVAPLESDELRLTLRPAGEAVGAHLQAGSMTWEETVRISVDPDEVDEALAAVSRVSRQGVLRSSGRRQSLDPVQELGARLFSAVFEGRLGRIYSDAISTATETGRTLPVRVITSDARLGALPWEFLYDPRRGDFVALSTRSPLVRQFESTRPTVGFAPITPPLKVLLLCADPTGDLGTARDIELLEQLQSSSPSLLALTVVQSATRAELQAALAKKQYHIVNFSGTGTEAQERSRNARRERGAAQLLALVAERDREYELHPIAETLAGLRSQSDLRLVYFSACHTDEAASVLVPLGVPSVIGWRGLVAVDAYVQFSTGLYRALLGGASLETAVTDGRRLIDLELPGARDWGMSVFHLQAPSGTMLAAESQVSSSSAARSGPLATEKRSEWSALAARLDVYDRNLAALLAQSDRFGANLPEFVMVQLGEAAEKLRAQSKRVGPNSPEPLLQRLREADERLKAAEQMLGRPKSA
jgi:hypothetical protein